VLAVDCGVQEEEEAEGELGGLGVFLLVCYGRREGVGRRWGVTRAPEVYTPAVRRAAEEGSLGTGKRQGPGMIDVFSSSFFLFFLFGDSFAEFFFWRSVKACQTSLAMMVGCWGGKLTVRPSARLG